MAIPVVTSDEVATFYVRGNLTATALAAAIGISRTSAGRVLANGALTCAGVPLTASDTVLAGSTVELALALPAPAPVSPASSPRANVLFEDRFVLVADKPAVLLVHGDGITTDTLTARVNAHLVRAGHRYRAQCANRLDVGTSGCVLFGLAAELQGAVDDVMGRPTTTKRYLAVVCGSYPGGLHVYRGAIARDRHRGGCMRVAAHGRVALTRVRCVARAGGYSLLACELGSGRRHQVRVHLSHAGWPLVGDALYGGVCADSLMLHAGYLRFAHPIDGTTVSCETPWPNRFPDCLPHVNLAKVEL